MRERRVIVTEMTTLEIEDFNSKKYLIPFSVIRTLRGISRLISTTPNFAI